MQRCRSFVTSTVLALAAGALAVVAPSSGGQAIASAPAAAPPSAQAAGAKPRRAPRLRVQVLSNRADLISGGDALVAIRVPKRVRPRQVKVTAGKRVISRRFRVRPDGRFVALVNKLPVGRTVVKATAPGARRGRTVIVNHPAGGPVFTGPQPGHYRCQDTAHDAGCNEPVRFSWLYKSTGAVGLKPYDRANPPSDVATATTDQGVKVPFVVRREDGYSDRDRYTILALFQPGTSWKPWRPQEQWNHKLLITHGGGCGTSYTPGTPRLDDFSGTLPEGSPVENSYVTALGRGFAVASAALANTGHNCNLAVNAESLMMTKERLVERYGALRYTIGTGCSGGSIAQHTVANSYPGIYQGLITSCSYPDVLTAGAQFADYHLMRRYFEQPQRWAPGVVWSPTQIADVEGHVAPANAGAADEGLFKEAINPEHPCDGTTAPVAGDRSTRFDSDINPGGVRCSILDVSVNLLGRRPASAWSPQETAAGHGFAGIPFANSGVQYGLQALRAGRITPAQFVDLNAKLGGLDVNADPIPQRIQGDPGAITNAHRTGMVNSFDHTDEVAIINHGGPDPGIAHDYAHAQWTEIRMQRSQGHTDNRVSWFGPTPLIGSPTWANDGLVAMDRWLSAVEKDRRRVPLAQKIVDDRPDDVTDQCVGVCDGGVLQTNLSTPRQEAGGPAANDVLACQRVPLDRSAYTILGLPVPFTDPEWTTLQQVFPDGVCDWSRPGLGQSAAQTWLRYGDATTPRYGGVNLRRAPKRSGQDWFGRAFQEFWRK